MAVIEERWEERAEGTPSSDVQEVEADRSLAISFRINWEIAAYIALIAIAFALRVWDLGTRMQHHDESLHATFSWYLFSGRGYKHDPMMHGPLLFEASAFIYFLLGVSDATTRLVPALLGSALVGLPYFLRKHIGRSGALVAAVFLSISPSFLYFSRFQRHDIYNVVWTISLVILMFKHFEKPRKIYLYLMAAVLSLAFSTKEDTYITMAILGTFLLAINELDFLKLLRRSATVTPKTDVLVLCGSFGLPLLAGFAVAFGKQLNLAQHSDAETIFLMGVFLALVTVSAIVGMRWNQRVWLGCAVIFWGIFVTLHTTFFGNPDGFRSGTVGALQYWVEQQGVARGDQPWYYYLVLLPIYEYLPILFAFGGLMYFAWKQRDFGLYLLNLVLGSVVFYVWIADKLPWPNLRLLPLVLLMGGIVYFANRRGVMSGFPSFLLYWLFGSLILYGWAAEKMPWMVIDMALPIILLAAYSIGRLIDAPEFRRALGRNAAYLSIAVLLAFSLLFALANRLQFEVAMVPILRQQALQQNLALILLLVGLLSFAVYAGRRLGLRPALQIVAVLLAIVMLPLTARAAWQVSYVNGDTPVEMMVYTQTSPDVGLVMKEIDRVGFRTGVGKDVKVAYDSSVSWPFEWYLRDYKGRAFFGDGMPASDAPIVLVGFDNDHDARVKPSLADNYVGQRYKLRWWFPEDYRGMTFDRIWQGISDPNVRKKVWNFFLYREPFNTLGSTDFMMYVRKDLVAGPWATKGGVAPLTTAPSQPPVDQYATIVNAINGAQVFGTRGAGPGQFQDPKALAVGPDESIYVLDTGNNRVQKLDAQGNYLLAWGTKGQGDGQFNEPWGISVDKEGFVYVADTWNHRIQKFDSNGVLLAKWGQLANVANYKDMLGGFFGPRGIAVDASGFVYVTDTGNHRIQKFDGNGNPLATGGGRGVGAGMLNEPVGITIDGNGNVIVADTWNRRAQRFDGQLKPLQQFAVSGWSSNSVVNKPYGASDMQGNLFFTDPEGHRVLQFGGDGAITGAWGRQGTDQSSFQLPTGIAVDAAGRVLVADSMNHRVLRFAPLR